MNDLKPPPEACEKCGHSVEYIDMPSGRWLLPGCDACLVVNQKEREERQRLDRDRAFEESIPADYRNASLEDVTGLDSIVTAYHLQSREMFYLYGGVGTGKTYALIALHLQAKLDGRWSRYIDLRKFLFDLKTGSGKDYNRAMRQVGPLASFPGILLLDDLGSESISKVTKEALTAIIFEREQWKPGLTVIASNLDLGRVSESVDDRISSRIANGTVIEFKGKDRRLG